MEGKNIELLYHVIKSRREHMSEIERASVNVVVNSFLNLERIDGQIVEANKDSYLVRKKHIEDLYDVLARDNLMFPAR